MSPRLSIIPARAATDPALKPRDLQVLCVLGRHTDDLGWCTKSQVKMADEMDCARSTVFEAIERLIKAGYLDRHIQEQANGRDAPHWYRVIFDPVHPNISALKTEEPCPTPGVPPAGISAPPAGPERAPPAGHEPAPKNDPSRTSPLNESERERGREIDTQGREGQTKRAETLFYRSFKVWDRFDVSPKMPMLAAWWPLTWDEMQAAGDAVPRFLAAKRLAGMRHAPAISTYLGERMWVSFPPVEAERPTHTVAPPFGPLWAIERLLALLDGPTNGRVNFTAFQISEMHAGRLNEAALRREKLVHTGWPRVNAMHEQAAFRRGATVSTQLETFEALMEAVPVGSETFAAWRALHERRGWPWLPDPGDQRVVFFPAGGPEGLARFEAAVRGSRDDGGQSQAAE